MKTFKFKLQNLLQLRNQIREQLFLNWSASSQALQKSIQEKERLQLQLENWRNDFRGAQGSALIGRDFWREQRAASVLQLQWSEQEKTRQHLEHRTRQALNMWQEARKKEEALERLKDRDKLEWIREYERQEQKLNDERAGLRQFQKNATAFRESREAQIS